MPQITVNPNLAEAPDFTLDIYAIARDAIVAYHNITAEAAVKHLKAAWTTDNDARKLAWEQQELADREELAQREQEDKDQHRNEELRPNEQNKTRELEKKKPKLLPNFRTADWDNFHDKLSLKLNEMAPLEEIPDKDTFTKTARGLTKTMQATIDEHIKLNKPCPHSKQWWNSDLGLKKRR
ncbi:hypothetical protein B0H34DRAFT_802748 [Crassisporium funariophilum]|nr:hypothetical protein B0H34DRAFT_802748 [Crassisporium funariophilum]